MTTSIGCAPPQFDPSTYVINLNVTHVLLSCRAGYKYFAGDYQRSCEVNGTWSGHSLLCTVDSILPKAHLVVLIVGATIAAFLACIPYDFYRFRKRKKKVRDHQERLSLVTRIAPGHAKVVLDSSPETGKTSPHPPRRFGFKSLFSVFRFVGGKLKTSGDSGESSAVPEESGKSAGGNSVCGRSEAGGNSSTCSGGGCGCDGATASTLIFSPHHSSSCPAAENDVTDLYRTSDDKIDDNDEECLTNHHEDLKGNLLKDNVKSKTCVSSLVTHLKEKMSANKDVSMSGDTDHEQLGPGQSAGDLSGSTSATDPGSINSSSRRAEAELLAFQRSNQVLNQHQSDSGMLESPTSSTPDADNPPACEPATVEVTSINETTSSSPEQNLRCSPSTADFPLPKMVSPPSSASSPDVTTSSGRSDTKGDMFRTFHFENEGCSNTAYHSMPVISDAP